MTCNRCGTPAAAGRKFCSKCGNALAAESQAARPAPTRSSTQAASAAPVATENLIAKVKRGGFSIWWIVVPTLVFAFLSRKPVEIAIVAALGAGLWVARTKRIPETSDKNLRAIEPYLPYAPALQIVVVFVMLGGNIVAVAMIVAGVIALVHYRDRIIPALEPWWQIQSSIPPGVRKPLAIVVAGLIGYYFGKRAGGQEWTYTLISNSFGMLVAFLIIFTPRESLRRPKNQ